MRKKNVATNIYFVRKHICEKLVYIATLELQFAHMAGYWKCSNKTPMPL